MLVLSPCLPDLQRDIPMPLVTSGVEKGNLRELALARMGDLGLQCRDVRTREAGIQDIHHKVRAAVGRSLEHGCGEVHKGQQSQRGGTAAQGRLRACKDHN